MNYFFSNFSKPSPFCQYRNITVHFTIYFNTYGTSSASLDYITHILKKICHLDIHVGLFYHSEDAACVGYVNSVGAKRHFEYCPLDGNSLAGIPKVFLDRFSIGENRSKRG